MTDITIPKEALEEAVSRIAVTINNLVEPDARAHELSEDELREVALAAIRAAIEAWPGMHLGHQCTGCGGDPQIILPLTQETPNV